MNWTVSFEQRLKAWTQLREQAAGLPKEAALAAINTWWRSTPWRPYHLHWDDRPTWPDPWQLLSDNIYCDLARGLGIMYTITLLDHPEIQDAVLAETDQGNLVLIDGGKYILNWDQELGVNIYLENKKFSHQVAQSDLKQQLD